METTGIGADFERVQKGLIIYNIKGSIRAHLGKGIKKLKNAQLH